MQKAPRPRIIIWQELILILLFSAIIALFLNFIRQDGIVKNLIFSEAIGISIYSSIKFILWLRRCEKGDYLSQFVGIPVGGIIGILLGALLTKTPLSSLFDLQQNELIVLLGAAIIFGTAISYFFTSRQRLHLQQLELQAQAQKRSEYEKNLMQSQLQLLQAQIEPHFLFNALANVVSLIDTEPETAKKVLQQLSDFLRTSLRRTRNSNATVADEIKLLKAYLTIAQVRMGERLQFAIKCDNSLLDLPLPPLLVQPLVENAIKHGLENSLAGGSVQIVFQSSDDQLIITVSDTGKGIQGQGVADSSMPQQSAQGIGLKNIRERLQALYGKTAELMLSENQEEGRGVIARLKLPLNPGNTQT